MAVLWTLMPSWNRPRPASRLAFVPAVHGRKESSSEGIRSCLLDPDGHKMELPVGDLRTSLEACRAQPYDSHDVPYGSVLGHDSNRWSRDSGARTT